MANSVGPLSFAHDRVTPARDGLTGLPNRALFAELYRYALGWSARHETPLVTVTCTLHQLPEIERGYGPTVGDAVRRYVSSRIRRLSRPSDIAARIDSNEFVMVLTDFERYEDVDGITGQLRSELAEPFRVLGCGTEIRPTVELVSARDAGIDLDHPGLNVIDLRDEQLVSHFQPIIDVGDGSIAGAEALLRWAHPTYGLLTAGQFFGVAANGGMLDAIADSALTCAIRGWGELLAQLPTPAPRVFVNLGPTQLFERSIVPRLHDMLRDAGLIPDDVVVEITETEVAARFDDIVEVVGELRSTGIRIALDDFGSGHSSLGRLRRLPVDVVKVDQSLVRGCDDDPRARAMLESVLSIASAMGAECIVEGIETQAEATVVTEVGYRFVQGYQFGHPVSGEQFVSMMRWSERLRVG